MPFPTSPVNGQVTIVNSISYTWSSTKGAWLRTPMANVAANVIISNTFTALTSFNGNLTGNVTGNVIVSTATLTQSTSLGYLNIPQSPQTVTTAYSIANTDQGKHLYVTLIANSGQILIPDNGATPLPIGAAVNIVLLGGQNYSCNVLAAGSVQLYLAGNTATNSTRMISAGGMASLLKVAANTWYIAGVGVS
jgi:hypothetical protein